MEYFSRSTVETVWASTGSLPNVSSLQKADELALYQVRDEGCNEDFNKLKQEAYVMDYQVSFEELKSLMLNFHPTLNES